MPTTFLLFVAATAFGVVQSLSFLATILPSFKGAIWLLVALIIVLFGCTILGATIRSQGHFNRSDFAVAGLPFFGLLLFFLVPIVLGIVAGGS
jgi:hypothetical protein